MSLTTKNTSAGKKVWTPLFATLAFYVTIMVQPAEQMAEQSVPCTYTLYNRTDIDSFERAIKDLKNCTSIEGGLHLINLNLLNAKHNISYAKMMDRYALPKLREISGFLLVYQMKGLQSLSDLFPNLAVIRGENALDGHTSILITQNGDLKRIGLTIAVLNGSVHIRNNYQLCVENDVAEWKKYSPVITVDIQMNMPNVSYNGGIINLCRLYNKPTPPWPSPNSTSCHELCLGGCTGPSPSDCYVCRTFQHNDTCVKECPREKRVSLPSQRCVDEDECKNREYPRMFYTVEPLAKYPRYTVQKNMTCLPDCLKPYTPSYENGLLRCVEESHTGCGKSITTLTDFESYRGCTSAPDSLEIKLERCAKYNSSEYEKALENLSGIEEVKGGLYIQRLHGVRNLHFLKSLRKITNKNSKFVLLIDENSSLTELFAPNVTKNLKIVGERSSVLVSNNPMLCSQEIEALQKSVIPGTELLNSNNGRRAHCDENISPVHTTIDNITATSAFVNWKSSEILPASYSTVYFRPAPGKIIYSRLSSDFPSLEYWECVDNVGNNSDNRPFILNGLTSRTRYAFYVEVVGERDILQVSKIKYFWTKESRPSRDRPCSVTAWPYPSLISSESSLKVEWAVPQRAAFDERFVYWVIGEHLKDTVSPCSSNNFQRFRISAYDTVLKQCKSEEIPHSIRRLIIEKCNNFSDTIDAVLQRTEARDPADKFPENITSTHVPPASQTMANVITVNKTDLSTGRLEYFAVTTNTEAVVVNNLLPFGQYIIKVYICLAQEGNETNFKWESTCGLPGFGVGRSSAIENLDKFLISPIATPSNYSSSFVLQWGKSRLTNSLVWYTIEITKENDTKQTFCSDKDEYKFDFKPEGVYSICVTVESLVKTGETKCISYVVTDDHTWRNFVLVFFGIGFVASGVIFRKIHRAKSEDRIVLLTEDSFDTHVRFSDLPENDMENVPI